ncbi:MAG TPA: hypothetical protein VML55_18515 [Planctomycetaceae bacterium]|nr:hypothetical protein [Planctomycetaceae bacterium]
MCGRLYKLMIWLLVASLAHLPLPIWDGDDVGTRGPAAGWTASNPHDVDLILLGCDFPDDSDDGPTGDDPDDGTLDVGLGPAFRAAAASVLAGPLDRSLFNFGPPNGPCAIWPDLPVSDEARGDGVLVHAAHPRPATTVLRL